MAPAVKPAKAQASSRARRCHRARTSARIARSSLTRSVIYDFPTSGLPVASPSRGSSADNCLPGEGHQHYEQSDLPPALPILDLAGGVLRLELVRAVGALDGIRKLFDRGRGRVRFTQLDGRRRAALARVPREIPGCFDRKRHEGRVQREPAPLIVEIRRVDHQPAFTDAFLGQRRVAPGARTGASAIDSGTPSSVLSVPTSTSGPSVTKRWPPRAR